MTGPTMSSNNTSYICDEVTANRVVRRINAVRAYARHVEQWAAVETHRAEKQEERLMTWFGPQLQAWTKQRLGDGKRRSISLPGGTLGLRKQPVRPVVIDEPAVVAWCREHLPDALQLDVSVAGPAIITLRQWLEQAGCEADVVEKLRKKIVADHLKLSGECPPGMELGGGGEQFFVK